jgi:hypothetical protein
VYQAAFDEGKNSINASALVAQERERVSAILACEEAKGRELQAQTLALETDLNAEQAAKILASAPQISTIESKPIPVALNPFEQHMNSLNKFNVGVGANQDDSEQNPKDDAATQAASILAFLPAANVRK